MWHDGAEGGMMPSMPCFRTILWVSLLSACVTADPAPQAPREASAKVDSPSQPSVPETKTDSPVKSVDEPPPPKDVAPPPPKILEHGRSGLMHMLPSVKWRAPQAVEDQWTLDLNTLSATDYVPTFPILTKQ